MDATKVQDAVTDLLAALELDDDDHTADTPARVARYWAEVLGGYDADPRRHLARTFPGPANAGVVLVAGIRVQSTCAHHLLPISGTATVAYQPHAGDPVVGLSKLARLVDGYARRLQVQERLGHQVASALQEELDPVGAACIITAEHGCMTQRGVMQPATVTTTYSLAGAWGHADSEVAAVLAEHRLAVEQARR